MADQPGARNRLVKLQAQSTVKRPDGAYEGKWIDQVSVWAKINTDSGRAVVRSNAGVTGNLAAAVRYTFRIAFRRSPERGWRVVTSAGQIYTVETVRHDEATREWTDLVCQIGAVDFGS